MLLKGYRLPLPADKAVAPPSSLELHQSEGIWKEGGGSECLVQVACKATRMILVLLPKHPLVFSSSCKVREEIGFLSAEFSVELLGTQRPSGRTYLRRPHSRPSAPCSSSSVQCIERGVSAQTFPHPLHMVMNLRHAREKTWRTEETTIANNYSFQSQAAFLQGEYTMLFHTHSLGKDA